MVDSADNFSSTWYEQSIASREQELEKQFGPYEAYTLDNEELEETFPGFAFLCFPPTQERPCWLYVTHGLSQPTEYSEFREGHAGGLSGFGIEFAIATREEEEWPFDMLELLSLYILNGDKPVLPLDRIPASDLMSERSGGYLLVLAKPYHPNRFRMLSGSIHLLFLVGITHTEAMKAQRYEGTIGSQILECVLNKFGVGCITDRGRRSMTDSADFEQVWRSCEGS